jgi:hypothetical protein
MFRMGKLGSGGVKKTHCSILENCHFSGLEKVSLLNRKNYHLFRPGKSVTANCAQNRKNCLYLK